ncbi:uncharacterized protein METZ01_LOCUS286172 [marine metagenome]|uniref:dihydroneopterin aldolase n=1 Tax=marine metagenome TaxID=408172 RepID=A0A382L8U1_9ZZZZ
MAEDWIRIKGIRLFGYHGVHEEENLRGQTFEVDVALQACLKQAGQADAIDQTINYVAVYRVVEHVVTGPAMQLLEAVADRIASELLARFSVSRVVIHLRKPQVKMPGPVDTVEVEISRP